MSSSKILIRKINAAPLASMENTNDLNDIDCIEKNKQLNGGGCSSNNTMNCKDSNTGSNRYDIETKIDPEFEYKGYSNFGRILGRGSFGTVVECFRKIDNKPIALKFFKIKAIHKWIPESYVHEFIDENLLSYSEFFSRIDPEKEERMLPSEVACLLRAHKQDGVVKILDFIPANEDLMSDNLVPSQQTEFSSINNNNNNNNESIIGIVLERDPNEICLFDYLIQNEFLDELEAKVIMKQLVEISLNLLHNGILHGDLKSENILINPQTKRIKIIDFGSAQIIDSSLPNTSNLNQNNNHNNKKLHKCNSATKCNSQLINSKPVRTFRGTNLYKPPEYILHHCFYPRPSTVWTFGVILYDMVCGHFPFDKDSDVLTHQDKDIEFTRPDLTENFKDLVRKCLAFYVADRIIIEKILLHPWMK